MRGNTIAIWLLTWLSILSGCATVDTTTGVIANAHYRNSVQRHAKPISESDAADYARLAVPFAHISSHVYCKYLSSSAKADSEECEKQIPIGEKGWVRLFDSLDLLSTDELETGLAFVAYARERNVKNVIEIIIGFRGTDFMSGHDWRANLRWFARFFPGEDQYDIVYRHSAQITDLAVQSAREKFPNIKNVELYTTGHSLGGGLAQVLGYSDSRYIGSLVFDPTPVTGYSTVVEDSLVNCGLKVLKIYERGEVLQIVRSFTRQFYGLTDNVSELSMNVLHHHGSPIKNHSMVELHKKLVLLGGNPGRILDIPGTVDCICTRRRPEKPNPWTDSCSYKE